MLLVKTRIDQSPVHGIGLFAAEFIPKGTVTWQRHPTFDIAFTEKDLQGAPENAREKLKQYSYFDEHEQKFILCSDNQRFINHSIEHANIISTPDQDIAARDIQEDEELLCNYRDYEKDWFERRGYRAEDFRE